MKKYNLSEIMKHAWELFKDDSIKLSFSECLRASWKIVDMAKWFVKKLDAVSFMAIDSGMAVNDIILEKETEKAVMLSTEWNGYRKLIWIPKSVISYTFA